jgi:hypothetical protein
MLYRSSKLVATTGAANEIIMKIFWYVTHLHIDFVLRPKRRSALNRIGSTTVRENIGERYNESPTRTGSSA